MPLSPFPHPVHVCRALCFCLASQNGLNALHLAAKEGHVEVVAELIKLGASVDAATKVRPSSLVFTFCSSFIPLFPLPVPSSPSLFLSSIPSFLYSSVSFLPFRKGVCWAKNLWDKTTVYLRHSERCPQGRLHKEPLRSQISVLIPTFAERQKNSLSPLPPGITHTDENVYLLCTVRQFTEKHLLNQ